MTQRTCKKCNLVKDLSEFANAGTIKGVDYKRHLCIPCYSESKKPRRLRCRQSYYDWKKTLSCERCGFDDYRALHFHHAEANKESEISVMMCKGFSLDKIKKEAEKCIVLCANCHSIEHFNGM